MFKSESEKMNKRYSDSLEFLNLEFKIEGLPLDTFCLQARDAEGNLLWESKILTGEEFYHYLGRIISSIKQPTETVKETYLFAKKV